MSEIKPCPFCGSDKISVYACDVYAMDQEKKGTAWEGVAACRVCEANLHTSWSDNPTEQKGEAAAIAAWNRRADPEPEPGDRERAEAYYHYMAANLWKGRVPPSWVDLIDWNAASTKLAAEFARVRAEERERIEVILKVLLDDLDIGEQYDKPGGMKPTCHPELSRMLPSHRNHIRRLIAAAIRKGEP